MDDKRIQTVPIATNVVSVNSAHGKVYSMQNYVINFASDIRQVGGVLQVFLFPPLIKLTTILASVVRVHVASPDEQDVEGWHNRCNSNVITRGPVPAFLPPGDRTVCRINRHPRTIYAGIRGEIKALPTQTE